MADLIDRKAAFDAINKGFWGKDLDKTLAVAIITGLPSQPTIEAEPVRRGRWLKISQAGIYECSVCGQNVMTSDIDAYRYCHGCGRKVRKVI